MKKAPTIKEVDEHPPNTKSQQKRESRDKS